MVMEGPYFGPSTGTPLTSKYYSDLAFVMEMFRFVGGEDPQPRELGCFIFMETPFFQKLHFLFAELFSWHFSKWPCSPTSPAEQGLTVFHRIFIAEVFYHRVVFLSQDFYHRVFSTLVRVTAEIVIREPDFTSPSYPKAEVKRC